MNIKRPGRDGQHREDHSRARKESGSNGKDRQGTALLSAFQKHQSALKRFISRYLHNTHDIEDVVQEAYLRAFIAGQTTDIKQPKSFLFRIAKNVAVSELRLKSRQITDYIDDYEGSDVLLDEGTVEDEAMARQKLGIHCEAVASLAPQCRKVYLMRKVYGMSHNEIAERLGVAPSTVRNQLMKGVELCDRYVRERTADRAQPQARARHGEPTTAVPPAGTAAAHKRRDQG